MKPVSYTHLDVYKRQIQRLNEQICAETLSTLSPSPLAAADTQSTVELDDSTIEITLKR